MFLFTSQGPPGASGNAGPPGRNGSTVRQQLSLSSYFYWYCCSGMKILLFRRKTETSSRLHRRNLKMAFSLWNASNVFRPHYARRIWKRISRQPFWIFVWLKSLGREIAWLSRGQSVFKKCFLSPQKRKAGVLNSSALKSVFERLHFSWLISVDERPSCRNKAEFFKNSPGVVWMSLNQRNALHQCFVPAAALLHRASYPREVW